MKSVMFCISALLFIAPSATATIVYQTGFEAPVFSAGYLVPQDGWDTDGGGANAQVQTSIFDEGQAAARIDSTGLVGSSWWFRTVSYAVPVSTAPFIRVEWDMYMETSAAMGSWGIDIYMEDQAPAYRKRASGLVVDRFNRLRLWDADENFGQGGWIDSGVDVTRDAWHHYRIDLNYQTNRVDFYVDGAPISTDLGLTVATTTTLLDADLYNISPSTGSNDRAYYDDFRIVNLASTACVPSDANCDSVVDPDDIPAFLDMLLTNAAPCEPCAGDVNADEVVDGRDIQLFIDDLLGQ